MLGPRTDKQRLCDVMHQHVPDPEVDTHGADDANEVKEKQSMLFLNACLSANITCNMFEDMPLLKRSLAMLQSLRTELERSEAVESGLSGSMKGREEEAIAKTPSVPCVGKTA